MKPGFPSWEVLFGRFAPITWRAGKHGPGTSWFRGTCERTVQGMGDDDVSYVKGHYRKRPGGGRTWVSPHTRRKRRRAVAVAVGGAGGVTVVALAAAFVYGLTQGALPPPASDQRPAVPTSPHAPTVQQARPPSDPWPTPGQEPPPHYETPPDLHRP